MSDVTSAMSRSSDAEPARGVGGYAGLPPASSPGIQGPNHRSLQAGHVVLQPLDWPFITEAFRLEYNVVGIKQIKTNSVYGKHLISLCVRSTEVSNCRFTK